MNEDRKDILMNYLGEENLPYKREFTATDDFFALKDKLVEKGDWLRFLRFAKNIWENEPATIAQYDSWEDWLLNPSRCNLVAEWLKEGK